MQQKAFFEIVRDGVNSMKITVTGNTMESETSSQEVVYDDTERVYYDSWDEVKQENPDIMTPGYIPEGLELEELYETYVPADTRAYLDSKCRPAAARPRPKRPARSAQAKSSAAPAAGGQEQDGEQP